MTVRVVLGRVSHAVLSMLLLSLFIFGVVRVTGDPTSLLLPETVTVAQIESLRAALGLDRPLIARDAIVEYEHPTRGTVRMPGSPVRFSEAATPTRRPPLLGEHTEEVLQELLGYDGARVAQLRAEGVL